MEQTTLSSIWKTRITLLAMGISVVAVSTGGWFYYCSRLQDVPRPPGIKMQPPRAEARLVLDPHVSSAPRVSTPSEPLSSAAQSTQEDLFETTVDPMEGFRKDLNKTVLGELGRTFPELQTVLEVQTSTSNDPAYRRVLFQLLDAAQKAPADRRPAILFAADLVAQEIWCAFENKAECDQLRVDFARYQLTLAGVGLGAVFIYPHDLLWLLWRDYPETDWGERAFVLLLNDGWDTSGTCQKGAEQFREVIREGESFLQLRPRSPRRGIVTLLVGQAYATWWTLSNMTEGGQMSDYVDPKHYQAGAEDARIKARGYFEQVLQLAPDTMLAQYARQVLPRLRDRKTVNSYRFFCIYD
jgi:hypothetical protein